MQQILQYKDFQLSDFQIESIEGILDNKNVILSTHTGNGKTLVADFAVNECFHKDQKVIYTAPIKALSNQKYNQFLKEYGEQNVGLVTGDRVINENANILVVTTEVLRNMIHESSERVDDIKFIILDEIHYISNEERGTVWEEVIIFKNKNSRIIGLSATIPNIKEFCDWIQDIHQEGVKQVYYPNRIIPQKHYYFDKKMGKATLDEIYKNYEHYKETTGYVPYRNTHIDFVHYAEKNRILPVLYFVFSRKQCEGKALEISQEVDLLSDEEKNILDISIKNYEKQYPQIMDSKSWQMLKVTIYKGIGYHHAGLLPIIKQFIEVLFEQKICKVLYATETFAVGINYPVKTVCFDGLRKFDGKDFRNLLGSEYLQMAGRAGRRGIDEYGLVFVLADYKAIEHDEFLDITDVSSEPIKSQFNLSYNTLINLSKRYSEEEIYTFFRNSLANFQYLKGLEQYEKELKVLKKQNERTNSNLLGNKCNIVDINNCPVVQNKVREKLKMLQIMSSNKKLSKLEYKIIKEKISELSMHLNKKNFSCPKSKRKECQMILKESKKDEKDIRRKEKHIEREKGNRPEIKFKKDYAKKVHILQKLGYMDENKQILPRGQVCSKIHVQELFVTELIHSDFFYDNDEDIINAVAAGIIYEDKQIETAPYPLEYDYKEIYTIIENIQKSELKEGIVPTNNFTPNVCGIMYHWSDGENLFEIIEKTSLSEGDFVSLCRRTIDLLRQIKNAMPGDKRLKNKIGNCINKIDRDLVKLGL